MTTPDLPVMGVLPTLAAHLADRGAAVLCAPPGSGKTTAVPPALMDLPWLAGQRIVMLEPRRVAARAAARYMASQLREVVGQRIGFRVRFESAVSQHTRVEVVTEGVLARRLQSDPELQGIGLVIFDEFHERSLECDLSLALTLDAREGLRPDLRVLVMSATLDAAPIARLLDDAPVVRTDGRSHPVEVRYQAPTRRDARVDAISRETGAAVRSALAEDTRDLLVFLPGAREIHAVQKQLHGSLPGNVVLCPLYGALPPEAQDRAILPDPNGRQRVVLATNLAETSLTIEGVGVVIDAGLARQPHFDPNTGLTRLRTVNISRASADQRAGRAGRLAPGLAIRLWSESEHAARAAFDNAPINSADLCSLVLELARWGVDDARRLRWLDMPPAAAWQQGVALLQRLGALDHAARITPLGERMAALPAHPRLASMLCAARDDGERVLAANLVAVLDGPDPLGGRGHNNTDLSERAELLARAGNTKEHAGAVHRARRVAEQLRRSLRVSGTRTASPAHSGRLLLAGFPDRLAQNRRLAGSQARGQFLLANGRGLRLDATDALAQSDYLVAPDLDAGAVDARAWRAAALSIETVREVLAGHIEHRRRVSWNAREQAVDAVEEEVVDALVLRSRPISDADTEALCTAMLSGIREMGLSALPWQASSRSLVDRAQSLRRWQPDADWPALDDEALLAQLGHWLAPYLHGMTRRTHLQKLDLEAILRNHLGHARLTRLEQGAPTHLRVPSGSQIRLDYRPGEAPVLAVKLQEMFGAAQTPAVCWGTVPVVLHLLSPAGRALHVTQDLPSFWANGYLEVRKEMRGRYPKHPWPEDPASALPTRHTKRRTASRS